MVEHFTILGAGLLSIFCLDPLGAFVLIFLLATGVGILGNELLKRFGRGVYDYGLQLGNEQLYHSPNQLLQSF